MLNPIDQALQDDVTSGAIAAPGVALHHLEAPMTTTDSFDGVVTVTRHRFGGIRVTGRGKNAVMALMDLAVNLTAADA